MESKRKQYQIVYDPSIKELKERKLKVIASTATPAIEIKMESDKMQSEIASYVDDQMIVAAPILVPNKLIYRKEEDGEEYDVWFDEQTIDNFQTEFARMSKDMEHQFNLEHIDGTIAPEFIKEQWIVRDEENDNSQVFGYVGDRKLTKGTWFGVSKFTDEEYYKSEIKAKEVTGFSIEGVLAMIENGFSFKKVVSEFKLSEQKLNTNKMEKRKIVEHKFEDHKLKDGKIISIDGEITEGSVVAIIGEDGAKYEADNGDYELEDGTVITVTDGKISAVSKQEAQAKEEDSKVEDAKMEITPEIQAKFDAYDAMFIDLQNQINELKAEDSAEGDMEMESEDKKEDVKMKSDIKFSNNKVKDMKINFSLVEKLNAVQKFNDEHYTNSWGK